MLLRKFSHEREAGIQHMPFFILVFITAHFHLSAV